jgi:regulatory protein
MTPTEAQELEQAALRLLANREHSREELRRKLASRAEVSGLLEKVLDGLESNNYLNDARFVEQYVGSRGRRGFGPLRIRQELRERGIGESEISSALEEGASDWLQQMDEVARKKFGPLLEADFKERARRARFLEYRGFPHELIRQYLWGDEP